MALISDTVGFIQKLPAELVAAFRATLEEINEADLLLHVVDIKHPNAAAQAEAVYHTLADIAADHIPMLTILNKIDRLSAPDRAEQALEDFKNSIAISALTGNGIPRLLDRINEQLFESFTSIQVQLPYRQGGLISMFHEYGQVDSIEHVRGESSCEASYPAD